MERKKSPKWIGVLVALAAGCVHPPLNSMVAAHGNTDWHIDTANQFVTGSGYTPGSATVANHVPDNWIKSHIHIGATNTSHYYTDATKSSPADDIDANSGIDNLMLFFYAGHGNPTVWNTLGNNGTQGNVLIGNPAGKGYLRYYWQCSCEVFAHGPQNGTCGMAGTFEYACPGDFDGSADSATMRNVYERWGPALGTDLRMACGASTEAYCHEGQADKIWDDYNNNGFSVADSFLDGLSGSGVVPLCIAAGGENWVSPLTDQTFTNDPNKTDHTWYYTQFVVAPPKTSAAAPSSAAEPPAELPVLVVNPAEPPAFTRGLTFSGAGDQQTASDAGAVTKQLGSVQARIQGAGTSRVAEVRLNRLTGAVYLRGDVRPLGAPALDEAQYGTVAAAYLEALGLVEKGIIGPEVNRNVLERRPAGRLAGPAKVERAQKNAIVTFRRGVQVEGVTAPIPVLGNGGLIKVQLNNDGSLLNLTKVWRSIGGTARMAKVKSVADATAEALKRLANPTAYKVGDLRWGYKELAGNVGQKEMRVVYQIELVPLDKQRLLEAPPAQFEIDAQP
jgi:hypothetical protein